MKSTIKSFQYMKGTVQMVDTLDTYIRITASVKSYDSEYPTSVKTCHGGVILMVVGMLNRFIKWESFENLSHLEHYIHLHLQDMEREILKND